MTAKIGRERCIVEYDIYVMSSVAVMGESRSKN